MKISPKHFTHLVFICLQYMFLTLSAFSPNKLIAPFPIQKQGISTLLVSVLYSPFLPPVHLPSHPPTLLCTHFPLHTLMQLPQSPVPPCLRLLQSKAYIKSQRYPPPNSDYENDNLVFSASSGIATSFKLVLLSNTMRVFLKLDLFTFSFPSV